MEKLITNSLRQNLHSAKCWQMSNFWFAGQIVHIKWWWRGVVVSTLSSINEVNQHRARLLLGWVTVCGQVNRLGM